MIWNLTCLDMGHIQGLRMRQCPGHGVAVAHHSGGLFSAGAARFTMRLARAGGVMFFMLEN